MTGVLTSITIGLVVCCALFGWVFVLLYSRRAWWKTEEGRHLMRFTLALSVTFTLVLVFRVVRPDPLTGLVLAVGIYGWIACELAIRIWLLIKANRDRGA